MLTRIDYITVFRHSIFWDVVSIGNLCTHHQESTLNMSIQQALGGFGRAPFPRRLSGQYLDRV